MTEDCGEKAGPEPVSTWSTRLYHELRQIAASQLSRQPPGQTLQATALVHEAWLKLGGSDQRWQNRAHFFGAAAQAIRQILIDQARRKAAVRHGGEMERVDLSTTHIARTRYRRLHIGRKS